MFYDGDAVEEVRAFLGGKSGPSDYACAIGQHLTTCSVALGRFVKNSKGWARCS